MNVDIEHDDYESEPIPGLPERLPAGEKIVWQGSPNWRRLAIEVFQVRKVGIYFALLAIWEVISAIDAGTSFALLAIALGKLLLVSSIAIGLLGLLAWGSAKEAVYTVTNRRVVMRFGIALRLTLNLPYKRLDSASLKLLAKGTGDIALLLNDEDRISYAVLWPHARRWQIKRPEPTLRCVDDAQAVATLLAEQLQDLVSYSAAPDSSEALDGGTPELLGAPA